MEQPITFDKAVAVGLIKQCESGHYLTASDALYKRFTDEGKAIGWIGMGDYCCFYCGAEFVKRSPDGEK